MKKFKIVKIKKKNIQIFKINIYINNINSFSFILNGKFQIFL